MLNKSLQTVDTFSTFPVYILNILKVLSLNSHKCFKTILVLVVYNTSTKFKLQTSCQKSLITVNYGLLVIMTDSNKGVRC